MVELDWAAAPQGALRALGDPPPDYVIAADCLYVDPAGATPDARAFVATCAALSGPRTRCYVALEERSGDVMREFFACAAAAGFGLVRGPHAGRQPHACGFHCEDSKPVVQPSMTRCVFGGAGEACVQRGCTLASRAHRAAGDVPQAGLVSGLNFLMFTSWTSTMRQTLVPMQLNARLLVDLRDHMY